MSALTIHPVAPSCELLEFCGRLARMTPTALGGRVSGRVPRRSHALTDSQEAHLDAVPAPGDAQRTDEELLVAYRTGDRAAFAALVERYRNDLVQFLHRFLSSRAAAEDVFQDAFLQVHLSADSFDADRRFKPWLYTIAANKARDFHRKRKRRAAASLSAPVGGADGRETSLVDLLEGPTEEVDAGLIESERQQMVKDVVDAMPAHYREILLSELLPEAQLQPDRGFAPDPARHRQEPAPRLRRELRRRVEDGGRATEAADARRSELTESRRVAGRRGTCSVSESNAHE